METVPEEGTIQERLDDWNRPEFPLEKCFSVVVIGGRRMILSSRTGWREPTSSTAGQGEMTEWTEPRKDAEGLLRRVWGTPGEPGFWLPVDPIRIARELGIDVYTNRLAPNVAAVLAKETGQDPVIVLNASDSRNRQRFSCAHELGHYVRRTNQGAVNPVDFDTNDYEYTDFRSDLSSTGGDSEEVYANGFAASLLMPEAEVRKRYKDSSPIDLAVIFDVSQEAMQIRLNTLRIVRG